MPTRSWQLSWLNTPHNPLQVIVGSASVLAEGDFVYAYSSREPSGGDVFLVRWPRQSVYEGDLRQMRWWGGDEHAWIPDGSPSRRPMLVLHHAATEFTVHRDEPTKCYLQVQSLGFGSAVLSMRFAPQLTGPWSGGLTLYRPPEFDEPGIMIHQGKAHPHLAGADLVLSYSTNRSDFVTMIDDPTIYYPRFVRLSRE